MTHINGWGIFIIGVFLGFMLASFLASLHAKRHEIENKRLRILIQQYEREFAKQKTHHNA